jgi:hypothetical protein
MADTYKDYVVLPLRAGEAKKHNSTHGAYRGDNIRSLRLYVFRKRMVEFLDIAFGEGEKK